MCRDFSRVGDAEPFICALPTGLADGLALARYPGTSPGFAPKRPSGSPASLTVAGNSAGRRLPHVGEHGQRCVAAVGGDHAATGMRARTAQIDAVGAGAVGSRRSHMNSGRHSPWKMWPPVSPILRSTSGGRERLALDHELAEAGGEALDRASRRGRPSRRAARPTSPRRARRARTGRTRSSRGGPRGPRSGRRRSGSTARTTAPRRRRRPGRAGTRRASPRAPRMQLTVPRVACSAAGNCGRPESAKLTFSTGLSIGTASTRVRKSAGAAPSSRPRTRRASALQTTARAAIAVPSSSSTPSPGMDRGDRRAGRDHGAGLASRVGDRERDAAHPAAHVGPGAGDAGQPPARVMPRHVGRAGIARRGERPDHALAGQRVDHAVGEEALEHRRVAVLEHRRDRDLVAAQPRLDLARATAAPPATGRRGRRAAARRGCGG